MTDYAVFFDPSRKRWSWIKRISTVLGLLSVIIVSAFLVSVFITTPLLPGIAGITLKVKHSLRPLVHFTRHGLKADQFRLAQTRRQLRREVAKEDREFRAKAARPLIKSPHIVAAFYAPWQETGLHSLEQNADKMTHLVPAWVHLREDGMGIDYRDWNPSVVYHNLDVLKLAHEYNLNIIPVLSNAQQSDFDQKRVHLFLTTPAIQTRMILELRNWILRWHFQGLNVDFENIAPGDEPLLLAFLQRLHAGFAPYGLSVSTDLEANDTGTRVDWKAVAQTCDFVVVMASAENTRNPGPISSIEWFRTVLQRAVERVPREKLVMGIANYAYDWTEGNDWAEPLTYQAALLRAR